MDGVLVDLDNEIDKFSKDFPEVWESTYKERPDTIPYLFKNPKPIKGSIEAITKLYDSGKYDLFIATASPRNNPTSATEKIIWIKKYFGDIFDKKIFITHRKDLLIGDYLIDDTMGNGAAEFKGVLIDFGWSYEIEDWNSYKTWDEVLKILL